MRVYAARWIVPVAGSPVPHGAVAVDEAGRIAYAGPRAGAPPGGVTDLGDAALLPGLVDANARPTPAAVRAGLAAGVTTFAAVATSAASFGAVDALCASGARGVVYQALSGPDPGERAAAFAELRARVDRLRAHVQAASHAGRVRVGVSPSAVHAVHEELLLDTCAWAVGESLPLAIPAGESADEIAFLREAAGPFADALRARGLAVVRRAHSTVHLLAELGIAAVARPLLVYATHFDESDVALAAHYDCPVAHCPAHDAAEGHVAPVRALLDAGVRVGLGTASAARDGHPDVLGAARALPGPLAAAEVLHLATLGSARALGLDREIGSLEVGKQADFCAYALGDPEADPVAALIAASAGRPALLTVAQGRELARDGRVLPLSPASRDA